VNISEPKLFIDGRFRTTSGVEPVIDATTEELLGVGPSASIGDIDDAVATSRRALREWSATENWDPKASPIKPSNRSSGWACRPTPLSCRSCSDLRPNLDLKGSSVRYGHFATKSHVYQIISAEVARVAAGA
jgi:hypothetical protein